jgi:superfamily I DNA/RNA helicase
MDPQEILRNEILSQNPTDEQKSAIFADELEFLLRAAPGSGKTWTSCRRFIWRAAQWSYPVGGLALLSFTNVAIREFQQATIKLGQQRLLSDPNYIGTFDAFVERFILTPFGHLLNGSSKRPRLFTAPRPGDRSNKKLCCWTENAAGKKLPVYAWDITPYIEDKKVRFRAPKDLGGKTLAFRGGNPVEELMKLNYYTHSQRAYWAYRLLKSRPHIADRLAKRFPEIIVDEAQDTNMWLVVLLGVLRDRGARITLVGDPDQCIYAFAMADATSLFALKDKWNLLEKPLSKSFRCNDQIAGAAKTVGGNKDFSGRGDGGDYRRAFVIREAEDACAGSLAAFEKALAAAGVEKAASAILCRAHEQLQSIRGKNNYLKLRGSAKSLAEAAFFRDCRRDYKEAFERVEEFLRVSIWDEAKWQKYDDDPDSAEARNIKLEVWRFVKTSSGLPPVNLGGEVWISTLKERLSLLCKKLGVNEIPGLGQKIQKRGLLDSQLNLPLFQADEVFPLVRQETIHQVKGESIDGVLVLGSAKFWNSVIASVAGGENSEDRRLAYVAMTRARDLLVVSLPGPHYDKHFATWTSWGFTKLSFVDR